MDKYIKYKNGRKVFCSLVTKTELKNDLVKIFDKELYIGVSNIYQHVNVHTCKRYLHIHVTSISIQHISICSQYEQKIICNNAFNYFYAVLCIYIFCNDEYWYDEIIFSCHPTHSYYIKIIFFSFLRKLANIEFQIEAALESFGFCHLFICTL